MEGFVAKQVHDYQNGKISRRRLIESLTLAVTAAGAAKRASAAEQPGLDAALVNHVSYTARIFARRPIGIRRSSTSTRSAPPTTMSRCRSARRARSPTASPPTMCRSPTSSAARARPMRRPATPRHAARPARSSITIALTVADFDRERAKAQLAAVGVTNVRDGGPFSVYVDDPFGYEVQIAGLGVTAICGAEARATCSDKR